MGATPNKLYQVGVLFFCSTFPTTFGQFPTHNTSDGNCEPLTRQGVTENYATAELERSGVPSWHARSLP
jgi:hypothetical protein